MADIAPRRRTSRTTIHLMHLARSARSARKSIASIVLPADPPGTITRPWTTCCTLNTLAPRHRAARPAPASCLRNTAGNTLRRAAQQYGVTRAARQPSRSRCWRTMRTLRTSTAMSIDANVVSGRTVTAARGRRLACFLRLRDFMYALKALISRRLRASRGTYSWRRTCLVDLSIRITLLVHT